MDAAPCDLAGSARRATRTRGTEPADLTVAEVAARIRVEEATLQNGRRAGKGPKFWKPSARRVFYRLEAIEQWERERGAAWRRGALCAICLRRRSPSANRT